MMMLIPVNYTEQEEMLRKTEHMRREEEWRKNDELNRLNDLRRQVNTKRLIPIYETYNKTISKYTYQ